MLDDGEGQATSGWRIGVGGRGMQASEVKQVMTVLGPIPAEELGFTSMHEHILLNGSVFRQVYGEALAKGASIGPDEPVSLENIGLLRRNFFLTNDNTIIEDEELMAAEVAEFKASGGSAMVDMSPPGLRSNLEGIRRISQETGVHIVTTTGFYIEPSWPDAIKEMSVEQLAAHMRLEVERGIDDTGIRAGHLKAAITDLSERQERLLRAIARVSIQTGLSATIHQNLSVGDCLYIIDILAGEGMEPGRIIMAHVDGLLVEHDVNLLILRPEAYRVKVDDPKRILDRGTNIAIDCFGQMWDHELRGIVLETDWQRLAGLVHLIEAGYSGQIVIGTDSFLKMLVRRYGGEGYCRLTKYVVPKLREIGVTDFNIRQITVKNPARLLSR
jgi:phosphotriesterase-related protein